MILTESQMIYIPKNTGITNLVVQQNRMIYLNNFEFGKFHDFMPSADNIGALKSITDMVVAPMLDEHGKATGLFYFYNSAQGSINLNTVKKIKAISRLLGGVNGLVITTSEKLLIKVGL